MIEMIYKGNAKDGKEKERSALPKNIRQIGEAGKDKRIYIEDYVITFLEKTSCAVLLGEIWQKGNMKCLFVDGAVKVEEEEPQDESWEKIYRDMKAYFPKSEVLGWAKKLENLEEELPQHLADIHLEQFAGEDKILYLYEQEENVQVYLTESTGIKRQQGYCIYYEKNEQMQNYMIQKNEGNSVEGESKGQDRAIKSFRRRIIEKQEKQKQTGQAAKEMQQETSKASMTVRFLYGASMFLVLTILMIGATMIKNYNRMKEMEVTLQEMAFGESAKSEEPVMASAEAEVARQEAGTEAISEKTEESGMPEMTETTDETEKSWILQESSKEGVQTQTESSQTLESERVQPENRAASTPNVIQRQAEYTVREGDTLAIVCRMYYGNLDKLEEICELNQIADPNTILPGQRLLLP